MQKAVGESPASEDIVEEQHDWWVIGSKYEYVSGDGWTIHLGTCNARAFPLTPKDKARFHRETICPPETTFDPIRQSL